MRALVTGSNKGIGLAICSLLAGRGDDVIAACRRSSPELDALGVTVLEGIDVTDPATGDRLRAAVGADPLDLVVANAGSNESFDIDRADDLDLGLLEHDLRVNVVGSVRTVLAVLPNLGPGSRIMLVSSGVSAPGVHIPGSFGYKIAKAGLNQFGRQLAAELADREIIVAIVSPGPVNTGMLRASFEAGRTRFDPNLARDPIDGARTMLATAEAATLEQSGSFWSHEQVRYLAPDGAPPLA